jgi:hypothetical protein
MISTLFLFPEVGVDCRLGHWALVHLAQWEKAKGKT